MLQGSEHLPSALMYSTASERIICAGFMGTGAAVIRKSDQGLEGLILEKVNGAPLEKR